MAGSINITHSAYSRMDGQAELAYVAWLNTKTVFPRTITHLSTNPAQHRVTSLMRSKMLPHDYKAAVLIGRITGVARPSVRLSVLPIPAFNSKAKGMGKKLA